jgi:cysteine sulfinate desulfinase/cysteine desulfurase-like protein
MLIVVVRSGGASDAGCIQDDVASTTSCSNTTCWCCFARYPGNVNLSFAYVEGESLIMGLKVGGSRYILAAASTATAAASSSQQQGLHEVPHTSSNSSTPGW